MTKEFKLDDFAFHPAAVEKYRQTRNGDKVSGVRRYKKQAKVRFYRLEAWVLDRAFATVEARRNAWPILAVLVALNELHFTDFDHRNPIPLTTFNLQRFGLSRKQKCRALRILEK